MIEHKFEVGEIVICTGWNQLPVFNFGHGKDYNIFEYLSGHNINHKIRFKVISVSNFNMDVEFILPNGKPKIVFVVYEHLKHFTKLSDIRANKIESILT